MQRLHHFLKTIQKLQFCSPFFLSRTLSLMIYWYKKCTISSCYVIKENSIFEKKNNCMPIIEDCAFKKEHPIVFYWILKMWEADFDSGILIKLVVFFATFVLRILYTMLFSPCVIFALCNFRSVLFSPFFTCKRFNPVLNSPRRSLV